MLANSRGEKGPKYIIKQSATPRLSLLYYTSATSTPLQQQKLNNRNTSPGHSRIQEIMTNSQRLSKLASFSEYL